MDNSIYVLDNNVVLQITENRQVTITLPHRSTSITYTNTFMLVVGTMHDG